MTKVEVLTRLRGLAEKEEKASIEGGGAVAVAKGAALRRAIVIVEQLD